MKIRWPFVLRSRYERAVDEIIGLQYQAGELGLEAESERIQKENLEARLIKLTQERQMARVAQGLDMGEGPDGTRKMDWSDIEQGVFHSCAMKLQYETGKSLRSGIMVDDEDFGEVTTEPHL